MSGPAMRYRKKPVEVEAMQWTGLNAGELMVWTCNAFSELDADDRGGNPDATAEIYIAANSIYADIETGEWVISDARGFYPCKPDVFEMTYEKAG